MSFKSDLALRTINTGGRIMLRSFEIAFSSVTDQQGMFQFYFKGNLICEVEKEWFDSKQRVFFESIAEPT